MAKSFSFGSYVSGCSPIHAMNAQVKIILACAFSLSAFFIETWIGLAVIACVIALLYGIAHVSLKQGARGLAPVLVIIVFTVLAHALNFTLEGLLAGLFIGARIALLVFACMLLTFTTSEVELTEGLARLLGPLKRLRVPVDDLSLVVSLALRFIPMTADEAYAIRKAQMARGADFEAGSPLARMKAWGRVLVPLIVRLFLRAEDSARALDARCYGSDARKQVSGSNVDARSLVCFVVSLAALLGLCCLL